MGGAHPVFTSPDRDHMLLVSVMLLSSSLYTQLCGLMLLRRQQR